MTVQVLILAAGKGSRMQSDTPKALQRIANKTFLDHILTTIDCCEFDSKVFVLIGYQADLIKKHFSDSTTNIHWIYQPTQQGTGHAVSIALDYIDQKLPLLILYVDCPLISAELITQFIQNSNPKALNILSVHHDNPEGYGRIIRDQQQKLAKIVEQNDVTEKQSLIQEVNTGVMYTESTHLFTHLSSLKNNNAKEEYYLTDLIAILKEQEQAVNAVDVADASSDDLMGINDYIALEKAERSYQLNLAHKMLKKGLRLADSKRFDIRGKLFFGKDCWIDANVLIEGTVVLGDRVIIGANTYLKDVEIDSDTAINHFSHIENTKIGSHCEIGPFARLRPNTVIDDKVKVGNFVECKSVKLKEGSKVSHLSYLGDTSIGSRVNIGAGTIVCNFDGKSKHQTVIGNDVFIGSNTTLISPLNIASDSFIAAGSTITKTVNSGELVIARSQQKNIKDWFFSRFRKEE